MLHLTYKRGRRIGRPTNNKISYKGVQAVSISDLARKYNISEKILHQRIAKGWTLEEAIEIPKERKERKLSRALYEYNGQLLSVRQIAEKYNISEKNIYRRLGRGWSIDETIEIPTAKRKGKE